MEAGHAGGVEGIKGGKGGDKCYTLNIKINLKIKLCSFFKPLFVKLPRKGETFSRMQLQAPIC